MGPNTIAVLSKDPYIRLWDIETSDNVVLEVKGTDFCRDETFLSIDFNKSAGTIPTKNKCIVSLI